MATITPILRRSKTNAKGTAPIYVRIADGSKNRFVSLRERVRESQWNEKKGRVRKSHKRHAEINAIIRRKVDELEEAILHHRMEGTEPTANELKEQVAGKRQDSNDFIAYGDGVVDAFERQGKVHTAKRYKSVLKKLRAYTGEPFPFDRLTPAFLREYETHLIEHYENKPNTVASNFRAIRSILYKAIRDGYASQADNPFFQFKIRRQRGNRAKLEAEEIRAIEALDLEEGSLIWHVRNYFLFSFYCAGIRFRDVATMRWESVQRRGTGRRLVYRMSKTGTIKTIPLFGQAEGILGYYASSGDEPRPDELIFPLLEGYDLSTPKKLANAVGARNALVNKYLKKIASKAEIKAHLSFHVSRHSFADYARKNNWDVYAISKALGHANIKVTENYLKGFDEDALEEKMAELFGATNS